MRQIEDIGDYYLAKRRPARNGKTRPASRRKSRSDANWLIGLSDSLSEWSSHADAKAYDNL
jgi:hypothetical protein